MKLPDPDIQTGPWELVREGVQRNLDALASATPGFGGKSVEMRFGTANVTFSASNTSSVVTISHGLGHTPASVVASNNSNGGVMMTPYNITATTFDLIGAYPFGPSLTQVVAASWIAVG